jgi:hypothetical protein
VPASALLYHQGRALVYELIEKTKEKMIFARREVRVLGREGDRWILATGQKFAAGSRVVVTNAQLLLAEEFNSETDND